MMWYHVIEICNLEPLKIGSGGSKAHWDEPCKDYIPGSTLRGGAIVRMVRQGLFDDDPKSVLQHMECFNAYLYRNGQLYMPAPQHLRIDKHEYRRQRSMSTQGASAMDVQLNDLFSSHQESQANDDSNPLPKNALPDPFVTIRGGSLEGARPRKSYRLHHSSLLNRESRERANLFNYQALEPGQVFRSIIAFSEPIRQRVESMWSGPDIWYLGGSKGSGYGRCRVRVLGAAYSDYAEARQQLGIPAPASIADSSMAPAALTLTCLSDIIIRGKHGEPLPCLPETWIEEYGGIKIKRSPEGQGHFVQTGVTEGYNATWRARYPKETTIKAGSVMRYELEGQPDEQVLRRAAALLEQRRYGARIQDGYGWIAVNVPYPSTLRIHSEAPNTEDEKHTIHSHEAEDKRNPMDGNAAASLEEAHIAESIRLISKGLGSTRVRWLRKLVQKLQGTDNSAEALVIGELKPHHCRILMRELDEWLNASDKPEKLSQRKNTPFLEQTYSHDREHCSLAGVHFNGILEYLWAKGGRSDHEALRRYGAKMLQSKHGRIYYANIGIASGNNPDNIGHKRFIAELLREGLYIHQRIVEGKGISIER